MHQALARALQAIGEERDTARARAGWTRRLERLLPEPDDAELDATNVEVLGFLQLCQHLHERTADTGERLALLDALRRTATKARTGTMRGPLERCLDDVTERLCEELFVELTAATESGDVERIYRTLLRVCGEDEWLLGIAAAHPLLPGRLISTDLPGVSGWTAPPELLRKLEQEGAVEEIDRILGHLPEAAGERVRVLRDPERYLEGALERSLVTGQRLPLWLWHTRVMVERFDDLVHRIPWSEVQEEADEEVLSMVREHVECELDRSQERLETFVVLAAGFAGTLAELIETSAVL